MRTSTKKLLLWLYSSDSSWTVPSGDVQYILPELTPGGRRSLVAHLQGEGYLVAETLLGEARLRLTDHGQRAVEGEFPSFSSALVQWDGIWAMLVFLTAPASDPRFRYLRTAVTQYGAGQLTRGVYLYPGQFPTQVQQICQELYRGHVIIASCNGWQFGDERSTVEKLFLLSDAAETLSGISREVDQLLNNQIPTFGWSHSQKQHMFTVFDRLYAVIETDIGLVSYYFPQVAQPHMVLANLQHLTTRLS